MATSETSTQVSASGYSYWHADTHHRAPPPTPLSESLTETARHNERPSIELKISSSGVKIVNAVVVGPAGRPLYSITSDSKRTKLLYHKDNTKVATVDWDRSSPRMVFRGNKFKCKEWLSRARSETDSRIFVHGDSQFTWMLESSHGFLIPANRPGLAVAKWHLNSRTDELRLQIYQEVLVESGLLEAILLSIILLQSGHPFGDTLEPTTFIGVEGLVGVAGVGPTLPG